MNVRMILCVIVMATLAACGAPAATEVAVAPTATPAPATAPLDAYIEAVRAGNVDAALALFTDDAVVGDFVGQEEIQEIIEWDIAEVAAGNDYVGYYNVVETGDGVELDLRYHTPDGDMEVHEIISFENGKIARWTIVGPHKPVE